MIILIAPDKFKGSLTAIEVCEVIRDGLLEVDNSLRIECVPLADGGEGTCELLTDFSKGKMIELKISDPLFREIQSGYGLSNNGKTAFIEMAKASGLQLLSKTDQNPLYTSSFGTGQLIVDALNRGVDEIILGIGGSATNDAGMGMAEALGFEFFSYDKKLKPTGENLKNVVSVNKSQVHPRLTKVSFTVLCDVDNPLFGEHGAAYVFAPQKGADDSAVKILDEGLRHFALLVKDTFDVDINFPGAGAAGGLGGGTKVFLKATMRSGIDFIIAFTGLEKKVMDADLIITGEGKMDDQTLSGKVIQGVSRLVQQHQKPVVALTGKNELDQSHLLKLGIQKVIPLVNEFVSESEAIKNAGELLKERVRNELLPFIKALKK